MAKLSSIFVQDEKRAGSMIGSGASEALCAFVPTTAGFDGTGWLLIGSDHNRNSISCRHLRDISCGSRPQVPWSVELFNVEICLHCFCNFYQSVGIIYRLFCGRRNPIKDYLTNSPRYSFVNCEGGLFHDCRT